MALRRSLINKLGLFRAELDAGTATQTGGDTYAFYRLLSLGYHIVYNPEAIVWHRHRRSQEELRRVLYGYSVGTYAFLLRCLLKHREVIALYIGGHWFLHHHLQQLWRRLRRKADAQPLYLTFAEIRGVLIAPWAYIISRRVERTKSRASIEMTSNFAGGVE
jgi:GT2 family glycosyltransferase